jgi:hypothetical protein
MILDQSLQIGELIVNNDANFSFLLSLDDNSKPYENDKLKQTIVTSVPALY